jgi:ACS family tartrate transporter-like MFS transporter
VPTELPPPGVDPEAVRRKVTRRIVPLVFLMYIVAYIDRANAAFAQLQMTDTLHFGPHVFGDAVFYFFVGYLLLEIPGALLVERWSARKWFARILVTWGACSMATALVRTPAEFYTARFLLGLAEAGFFPGVIVYFTHWFPRADRARALAGMVMGIPVSLACGAAASGYLLKQDWLGLAGWQWVFLVEGVPAVLLGVAVLFVLTDRPRQASWLTPAERDWLEGTLERERRETAAGGATLGSALRGRVVWLLALGILVTNAGGFALTMWLPTAVKNFLTEMHGTVTDQDALQWTGVIYLCGLAGVWLSGWSSDRTGDRKWHCVAGQAMTGLALAASVIPGQPWEAVFAWLCVAGFFATSWPSPFWVLPTLSLSASAAAVSIGFVNICANVGSMTGSPIVGRMKEAGIRDRGCILFLSACYVLGGVIVSRLRVGRGGAKA